jgi:hypothetical protein
MTPDDADRWREFVIRAREMFDRGDAWAAEQANPEGVPLFEGADGWATAALRLACGKGRLALEHGDVAGIVLSLVEAGHAGRYLEIVNRWVRTLEATGLATSVRFDAPSFVIIRRTKTLTVSSAIPRRARGPAKSSRLLGPHTVLATPG